MTLFSHAIARLPGEDFASGITTSDLGLPSYARILEQHRAYVDTLESLGLEVTLLDPEPGYPDAYFVEDTAVVTPHVAVIANPGAAPRRGEERTIEPVLARHRPIARIRPPATLDGGDVLMVGNHFFVGVSQRTNREGAEQLGRVLEEYGHTWTPVPVGPGLHLKSSVNWAGGEMLVVARGFAERIELADYELIVLDEGEEYAANTLLVNDHLILPRGFRGARSKLEATGLPIVELDVSEARKMDGGLTCMSIRF